MPKDVAGPERESRTPVWEVTEPLGREKSNRREAVDESPRH